jgi:transposase-like protein
MTKPATSLIAEAAEAQALAPAFSFFSDEEREATERLTQAGEFTGERLYRDRPGIYSAIVRMSAEGLSISAAARALGVSRNTVVAVREREGISIEQDKRELMKLLGTARRLSVEKVIELIPDLKNAKDAAITAAVMVDKYALLAGEATSRVERVEVRPDQVQAYLDALPVVDAEFEVISMGIGGETDGQKAVPALALPSPKSDIGSNDFAVLDTDAAASRATPRTTSLDNTPLPGGGGGPVPEDLPTGSIDSGNQNFGQRAHSAEGEAASNAGEQLGGAGGRCHDADAEGGGAVGGPLAATILCQDTPKKKGGGPT